MKPARLAWERLTVSPLAERESLTSVEDILKSPCSEPPPCPESGRAAGARVRRPDPGRAGTRRRRDADLRRPPAAQRRGADPRADDGARLAHAPGHQRRRHDPRLGIRLARRARPRASETNVATGTFGTWDETAATSTWRCWPAACGGEGYGRRWAGSSARTARRCPPPDELEAAIRCRAARIR